MQPRGTCLISGFSVRNGASTELLDSAVLPVRPGAQVVMARKYPQVVVVPSRMQLRPEPPWEQYSQLQGFGAGWANAVRAVRKRIRQRVEMRASLVKFMWPPSW